VLLGRSFEHRRYPVRTLGSGEPVLDYPGAIQTTDFKVTGTGHERIERFVTQGCADRRTLSTYDEKQPELRIAAWICRHACSFVLFDTKARATVIGFQCEEDAEAFSERSSIKRLPEHLS
jgi:hypothetical protein